MDYRIQNRRWVNRLLQATEGGCMDYTDYRRRVIDYCRLLKAGKWTTGYRRRVIDYCRLLKAGKWTTGYRGV